MYNQKTNGNRIVIEKKGVKGKTYIIIFATVWLTAMIVIGFFAPLIAPFDYQKITLSSRLLPPVWVDGGSFTNIFGTDDLGRDILSRLFQSIRISLLVAILGTVISAVLGTTLGFIAAHFRGVVDDFLMMLVDFQASLPFMILALTVIAFFESSLLLFIGLMGIYGWERYARFARGLALSAEEQGYAVAVRSFGASPVRIYLRHILPNVGNTLVVNMTLNFPKVIMMETSLSFLGLGIQPPETSLGNMVGFGRDFILTAWWMAIIPAVTIFLTTLTMSILGDWVRDKLDPSLK
ncbi:MAG: ABC transporter permease [Spirochaetia bacterium]|jgi:peptide/nickel transport system permease protein|nr:ABC transporter permease [Spirochaetia bacterium]